ncbi:hypothetical protein GQ457_05G003310 [Hibiscus cannabinus]
MDSNPTNETRNYQVEEKPHSRRLLDEQFDILELQEYGSDDDDCEGYMAEEEEELLADKLKNVLNENGMDDLKQDDEYKAPAADIMRRCAEYARKYENESEDEKVIVVQESSDESEQFDSLSAKSPVISLRGKEKLRVDFLPNSRKATTEKVEIAGIIKPEQIKRKQHGQETKEEKKERKLAVKMEQSEARKTKKATKELYWRETQQAQKVAAIAGPSAIQLM